MHFAKQKETFCICLTQSPKINCRSFFPNPALRVPIARLCPSVQQAGDLLFWCCTKSPPPSRDIQSSGHIIKNVLIGDLSHSIVSVCLWVCKTLQFVVIAWFMWWIGNTLLRNDWFISILLQMRQPLCLWRHSSWNSNKSRSLNIGKYGLTTLLFYHKLNQWGLRCQSSPKLQKIVYFIWCGTPHNTTFFEFKHFLSITSAIHFLNPDAIYLFNDRHPAIMTFVLGCLFFNAK